jgi:hypothetical protein
MPETGIKSTIVRASRIAMGILEVIAPGLGSRWVDRIWFSVPLRDGASATFRPAIGHLSSVSVERPCADTGGETTRRSST